jgi:ribosomal protein L11 methyltransferase
LASLASKAGASEVCALDLDPNCIDNCRKNVQLNKCNNVKIVQAADLSTIQGPFDIIMSNIIRSVNIELLHSYVENAKQGAIILLSGLLLEDETQVLQAGEALNLHYMEKDKIENWIQLTFRKP